MATFSRGFRCDYKRGTFENVSGVGTVTFLTVPSNSNYIIFINKIIYTSMSTIGVNTPQAWANGSPTSYALAANFVSAADSDIFVDYFGQNSLERAPSSTTLTIPETPTYGQRFVLPDASLVGTGGGAGDVAVYYQQIYFGGTFNY